MREKRVSIEVEEEARRKLKVLAAERGVTIKELVSYLVEQAWAVSRETQS